ncbi:RNA polymerase sigma factor RpoD, partial [Massilia sp. CT11-108]
MKNTAKTLTLTAKKAPAKSTAQLSVPKTATSYFLETEAAAKVTVVKTRSRLASLKAVQAEEAPRLQPEQFDDAAAGEAQAEAVAADVQASEDVAEPVAEAAEPVVAPVAAVAFDETDDVIPTPTAPAAPPVIVKKRISRLAALKADT